MKIADAISNILSAGTAQVAGVQQQIDDAKQTAVTAYAINTGLQLVGTVALVYIAYKLSQRKG